VKVEIDGNDRVIAAGRRAEMRIGRDVDRAIQRSVQAAVDGERTSHLYTNRTGRAEASTRARADGRAVTAEMAVQYAEVLNRRGWSEFHQWMDNANADIHEAIDDLSEGL
jgi:hypothetical protein